MFELIIICCKSSSNVHGKYQGYAEFLILKTCKDCNSDLILGKVTGILAVPEIALIERLSCMESWTGSLPESPHLKSIVAISMEEAKQAHLFLDLFQPL